MKRLGLLLMFFSLPAIADVVVPIDRVQRHVNIRMSPDSRSEVVGKLNQGDWVALVGSTAEWHEVEIAGGATGFISVDWTNVLDEAPPLSQEVAPEEEEVVADESGEPVADTGMVENVAELEEAVESAETAAESIEAEVVAEAEKSVEPIADEEILVEESAEEIVDEIAGAVKAGVDSLVEAPGENAVPERAEVLTDDLSAVTAGPPGPPGPAGAANVEGSVDFLMKFTAPTIGGSSQIFDDGNKVGIGTTEPQQRLEVNGNIQIHEQNSSVAGLMITQSDGDTGYIMHNRASTLTIGAGSIDRITIDRDGNVGFGVNEPANPLEMASGAHVTAGGVWTNSSSGALKENIAALTLEDALDTLAGLEPVHFNYKTDQAENYIGFIAEDVPDLVATRGRDGLSSMDIVAILTKVVQDQQKQIDALEARLDQR